MTGWTGKDLCCLPPCHREHRLERSMLGLNAAFDLHRLALLVAALALLGASVGAVAEGGSAAPLAQPVLITSAGQSTGALMVRMLANKAGLTHFFDGTAEADDLQGVGSLIVVVGVSMKGLGAAGIDADGEFDRVQQLLKRAREQGIPVVVAQVEGASRRGSASDDLSAMAFSYADFGLVRQDADDDGFFTALAAQFGIPLEKVDAMAAVTDVLKAWYGN